MTLPIIISNIVCCWFLFSNHCVYRVIIVGAGGIHGSHDEEHVEPEVKASEKVKASKRRASEPLEPEHHHHHHH